MSSSVSEFSEPRRAAWASLRPASSLGRNFRAHCRIKATFPTGPKNELRWHDGFVFDHNQLEREEGEGVEYQYTLFFPINATDIMKLFPHPSTAKTSASASSTFPTRRRVSAR